MGMIFRQLVISVVALLITGCAFNLFGNKSNYNEQWSKAKNLAHAGGIKRQVYDQQLPAGAYDKNGKLQDYKLGNITHPAYGSGSGVAGVNIQPYGVFEYFYWGWTVPGIGQDDEYRLFAWMPEAMGKDVTRAREKLEILLSRASLGILENMNYKSRPIQTPYEHHGIKFKQWYLEQTGGGRCSFARMNCVLSIYLPPPVSVGQAPFFAYHNVAGQPAWFFSAGHGDTYPRLAITEGGGTKSINGSVFYQKLSARMPGWIYLYLAPNKVGTGDNNKTIGYPYLLEKGKPLLFIRPLK